MDEHEFNKEALRMFNRFKKLTRHMEVYELYGLVGFLLAEINKLDPDPKLVELRNMIDQIINGNNAKKAMLN